MLLLSIPKPCHENWNEMSPREQGAFCQVCSKTVVDFTSMSDEEVKNYFLKRSGQRTCGRLRNDQLVSHGNPLSHVLEASIPFWKKFLAIVFILFGAFLSACNSNSRGNSTGDISATRVEKEKEFSTMGIMSLEPDPIAAIQEETCLKDTAFMTKGDVVAEETVMVGEIIEEYSVCPDSTADSVIKIFDKHGREIKKQAEPEDSSSSPKTDERHH
jgi:hypothetical protein